MKALMKSIMLLIQTSLKLKMHHLRAICDQSMLLLIIATVSFLTACGGGSSPSSPNSNSASPATSAFSVTGSVIGLSTNVSMSLNLNSGSPLPLAANGVFVFPNTLMANAPYLISVGTQPLGQTCSVTNGSGTVSGAITNVLVSCVTVSTPPSGTTMNIGGNVSGLSSGTAVGLLNNGIDLMTVNGNGTFSFTSKLGSSYAISVASNPAGQLCSTTNAAGVTSTSVSNVLVTCRAAQLSVIVGSGGGAGSSDGIGSNARFNHLSGNAVDSTGNVYVADSSNQTIRKITPDGVVTTFAGTPGVTGATDGPGVVAQFCAPTGLAIDNGGFLYVTEECGAAIRKISPTGVVSTFAGTRGKSGSLDGALNTATFGHLSGIAIDAAGTLYTADIGNNTIRKVSPYGNVTTLAGISGVYGSADGIGSAATFSGPTGITVDAQGNVFVVDSSNQTVRKITATGIVSTLAGTVGVRGNADGLRSLATFNFATPGSGEFGQSPLSGIVIDNSGTIFLTDYFNNTIRKISSTGFVTTVVGGFLGYLDAQGSSARLRTPTGLSIDSTGNFYVSEEYNWTVRKVSSSFTTTTIAGKPLIRGSKDGIKGVASFNLPTSVAADAAGDLYVADNNNNVVRKISVAGVTTTLAGNVGVIGTTDGPGSAALFYHPSGIVVDGGGNVYVSDQQANTIRKISSAGVVSTLAGDSSSSGAGFADGVGSAAKFFGPMGLALDSAGNVYVADAFNSAIRKVSPSGVVTTIGNRMTGLAVTGVAVDAAGNVYFSSANKGNIQKISLDGTVAILAGSAKISSDESGSTDGLGTSARFSFPNSIAIDGSGNVFVSDSGNCTVRMVTPIGVVSTIAGIPGRCEVHEGALPALLPPTTGIALTPDGQLVVTGNNAILRITGF